MNTNTLPTAGATTAAEVKSRPEVGDYRVAVFAAPDDPGGLIAALRQQLDLTEIDARVRIRNLPGVLPERLSQQEAERLAATVRSLGVDAAAMCPEGWPDLRHVPKAHHVRCTEAGLEVVPMAGSEVERIPWRRVALISIADVPLDRSHHFAPPQTVVIRGTPRQNDTDFTTTVRGPELWVVCVDPWLVLRIDHREMNYEYLGPRKSTSAAANFLEFSRDLVREAPDAYLTPPTRAFLAHDSVEKYRFDAPERHRELVEFHTVLMSRIRNRPPAWSGAPGAGQEGKEDDMNPALAPDAAGFLVEVHENLRREIQDLKTWLKEADEYGRPQFGQLGDRVLALRRIVAAHFAMEDEGGYMAGPQSAAPHLADRIAALHADHDRLLAEFDALAAKLRDCPAQYNCWGDANHDLERVLHDLEDHEHRENEVWQEAFDEDAGPGD